MEGSELRGPWVAATMGATAAFVLSTVVGNWFVGALIMYLWLITPVLFSPVEDSADPLV